MAWPWTRGRTFDAVKYSLALGAHRECKMRTQLKGQGRWERFLSLEVAHGGNTRPGPQTSRGAPAGPGGCPRVAVMALGLPRNPFLISQGDSQAAAEGRGGTKVGVRGCPTPPR